MWKRDRDLFPRSKLRLDLDGKHRHWTFYCPLCAVTRTLKQPPQPGQPIHYLQVGLCAVIFSLATQPWLDWKGLVSFVPFWMIFEIAYRLRMRARLRCGECGFDPFLAMTDVVRAKREVASHWERKLANSKLSQATEESPNPALTSTSPEG